MRRTSFWSLCGLLLALSLLPGSTQPNDATVRTAADSAVDRPPAGRIVLRAKHYITKGPCVRIGDDFVTPAVDGFEVTEVVWGKLQASRVEVRPLTRGGPGYPTDLKEGKVYTLRLTPSDRTKRQLRANETQGGSHVWVDGDELEEQRPRK